MYEIQSYYENIANSIHATKEFRPKIKDPDYGDIYEYEVEYYANRSVADLSSLEKYILIGLEILHQINQISEWRYNDLVFLIAYNNGKSGNPSSWSLPEGVEPHHVTSPTNISTAKAEALSCIESYTTENPDSEVTLFLNNLVKGGAFFLDSISDTETFTHSSSDEAFYIGTFTNKSLYANTDKSLITIAGSGSGKTQCHVLPNLNRFEGAAIVLDIKGECFAGSAEWRKENVGPILKFSPADPKNSSRYNPLSFISQDPDEVWEEARLFAELLVVPQSQSDPTWENQARQLLTLLIAYVVYLPEEKRTMASVLDLLNDMGLDDAFANILADGSVFLSAMRRAANNFKKMKETAEKQFSGVTSGALQHLAVWEGAAVERLTSASDWSPLDFRRTPAPTLYLIVPPSQIDTYAPLLRVIIAQHVKMLMEEEPDRDAAPILFMLDELPRLGRMEPILTALDTGRSYKIKLWMFAQYAGQLHDAYGKEIAYGMINESCGVRMYMNPGQETAEQLSKTLGTRENMLTGKTEPVVTPQGLTGPEWKDDILVLATGEKPLRLKKAFFHEQEAE